MAEHLIRIDSPDELAAIIQEAMAGTPLPEAVVLVPAAVAHQLRASGGGLPGVTFLSAIEAAAYVLLACGERAETVADWHLAPLIEAIVSSSRLEQRLRYFNLDQLRVGAGYAEALAATLAELDHAGLRPEDLAACAARAAKDRGPAPKRLRDIAAIWEALISLLGARGIVTAPQLLRKAARVLAERPGIHPFRGRTLALIDEQTSNATLDLLAAIPRLTAIHLRAFPERRESQSRLRCVAAALGWPADAFDRPAESGGRGAGSPAKGVNEIEILKSRLFRPPGPDSAAGRRSAGPDGTVHLEEHAGVEDELQAAVEWVSRQVLDHGVPLEKIALLAADRDPYAGMLVERLASLPWGDALPVYAAGGIPAKTRADGARLNALLEALESGLSAAAVSRLMPCFRLLDRESSDRNHLTFAESIDLAYSCGTLGGLAGRPESAREWAGALKRREAGLEAVMEDLRRTAAEDPEESVHARDLDDTRRLIENVRAVLPAMEALVAVHDVLLAGSPLATLWAALDRFAADWMLLPADGTAATAALRGEMESLLAYAKPRPEAGPDEAARLCGLPALRAIVKALDRIRIPIGKFGEPRLYVGTIGSAVGLRFDAARIVGLCEGAWPARPPVDPILPDAERDSLEPGEGRSAGGEDVGRRSIPRRDDRPLQQIRAFYRVVQGVRSRLVLSFARQSADGTIKEPSSLFLEAAAALGRPAERKPAAIAPSLKDLRACYFLPAREAERTPPALGEFTRCRQVACRAESAAAVIPASWKTPAGDPLDMRRMREWALRERSGKAGPPDGILPSGWPLPRLLGLSKEAPLSASRIKRFLTCPYWFFLQDILHWEEPPSAPPAREIGQPAYGSLLHRAAEMFFRENGKAFTARQRNLGEWLKKAEAVADREFDQFQDEYPLQAGPIREQERRRLGRDVRLLVEYEWRDRKGIRFRDVEFRFGYPEPVALDLGGRVLFVRGYIDRLDESCGRLLVRDIKSGKSHPREGKEAAPDPVLDVQLAVYALVVDALHRADAGRWPEVGGAAYVYPDPRAEAERAFEADLPGLLERGRAWLKTMADMIEARVFPRTIVADDCSYCPFRPVCGDQARGAAEARLRGVGGAVDAFLALKAGGESEPDESES